MRRARGPVTFAVLATLGAGIASPLVGGAAPALLLGYVASLVGCALWWLLPGAALTRRGSESVMAQLTPAHRAATAPEPERVMELEGLIAASMGSALDAQARLRPALRELACSLFETRRGIRLDPAHDDVAAQLGLAGEPLLAPRMPRRPDIAVPGPAASELGRVIAGLEKI